MIEKYRVTSAHRDTLNILKGYPAVIASEDLLFSFDATTVGIDGNGHKMYPDDAIVTMRNLIGRFGQSSVTVEQDVHNFITDSGFTSPTGFSMNWDTTPAGGTINEDLKPQPFLDADENAAGQEGFGSQTAQIWSQNFISGTDEIEASDKLVQSCWVKTDATAVRFSVYSTQTGHHYDDYITLEKDIWYYIESVTPYIIQEADLASGGQIREFHIETSANATKLYIFHPQTEIGDFATSWTIMSRTEGALIYSNSYFSTGQFTIGGWFCIKNFRGNQNALFSICDDYGALLRFIAYTDNTSSNELIIKGSNRALQLIDISTSYNVAENTWFHIILTFDGIKYKLYINGALNNTTVESRKFEFMPAAKLYLGTWFDQDFLNGYVNEFIISARVFGARLIEQIHVNEMPFYNPYFHIQE